MNKIGREEHILGLVLVGNDKGYEQFEELGLCPLPYEWDRFIYYATRSIMRKNGARSVSRTSVLNWILDKCNINNLERKLIEERLTELIRSGLKTKITENKDLVL